MSEHKLKLVKEGEAIKRKKVAILGTVPHKLQAPFDNDEFEIWAIAHACLGDPLKRVDRIFEIHKWDEVVKWGSPQAWEKLHPEAPVYLLKENIEKFSKDEHFPKAEVRAFPFDELAKKFQMFEHRNECYFTNSISEMVALAIDEEFDEIHIYGVNMSHASEYSFQKPSCEYYLGLARGMGKKIFVPTESDLCKSFYLYGKDEEKQTDMLKKLDDRIAFLQNMHSQHTQQQMISRDMMNKFMGAVEQWEAIRKSEQTKIESITPTPEQKVILDKVLADIDTKLKLLTEEYQKHRLTFEQSRDAINQHIGAIEDVKYMMLLMKQ
jgi:hypothetical protein